ncbi:MULTISPECIES: hypothetical protein [Pseudomonas]|uniref:hypothetical protein n=1 Tax=Pseudomonas TaxID=286 RepID=UPI001E38FF1C|nr:MULTISPECIES: hypothetical protein [Pseudomonas]MCE1118705.1 hypothetical protein [Pseudomonas sp. NMI795_08]
MNEFWRTGWAMALMITPLLIGLSGVALHAQLACSRDFQTLLGSLEKSPGVPWLVQLWGRNGFYSRMSLVCGIAGMIFCAGHCIRKGALDITDYKTFPQRLKKRLNISSTLILVGFSWFMLVVVLME